MPEPVRHDAPADSLLPGHVSPEDLLDAIPDSLYVCTREGLILAFRPARDRERWPIPPDGYVGKHVHEIVDSDLAEHILRTIREVLDTGQSRALEYLVPTPSGSAYREARFVPHGPDTVLALVRDVDARHRAEEERERLVVSLDSERRQLSAVLEQLPAMMVICDASGRVIRANRHFLECVGVSEAEMLGRVYTELPFDTVNAAGEPIPRSEFPSARALRGEHVSTEVGVLGPEGPRWLHVQAAPILNERGELDGAILTLRDLTAERAAADALRKSEATNRALLDAIPDALYRVSRAGIVLERRAPEDGRFRLHDVYAGRHLTDLLGEQVGGQLAREVEATLSEGTPRTFEYTWEGCGLVLHREARMVPIGEDEVLALVRDIGERRRAEQERECLIQRIDSEHRRLDAILRQLPNGLLVYDAEGKIVEINDALAAIIGKPKSEIVGQTAVSAGLRHFDEDGQPLEAHQLPSARALRGESVNCVLYGGAPHRLVWIQTSAAPIRDERGAIVGSIVTSRNITPEREAAEALRASEQRYRVLLNAVPDALYHVRADGTIMNWKPAPDLVLPSHLPADLTGLSIDQTLPPAVARERRAIIREVLETGQPRQHTYTLSHDGREKHREARVVRLDETSVLCLIRNVDAQVRAEREREQLFRTLEHERRRLSAILRQIPNSLIVIDRDGRIAEVNRGFLELLGLTREDVIGRISYDVGAVFRHPDGQLVDPSDMPSRAALNGHDVSTELMIERPGSERRWVRISAAPILDERGTVAGATVSTLDVTAERQAEAALQASEARMRALLDAIPDSIYVRSRDGVLLDFKPAGDGRPMMAAPDLNLALGETHPNELGRQLQEVIHTTLDTGILQTLEYLVPTPVGPAYREARVVPAGRDRVLALVRDIDARKRAEQELHALNHELEERVRERTAELEALNHELEAFSYSVSHDLKAPLRGIDGYSRLLWEDYQDRLDDDGRELLRNIRQGAAQMYQLIDDLLSYSRLERRPLDRHQIELRPLLDGLLVERAGEIAARSVRLGVDVPDALVRADREGLAQALRNLLENALRFTAGASQPEITVRAVLEPEYCILSIQDNGIGFDMAYHDRIFEIFQRLHRAEEYPGTGIGLALVRKAMQRMGGRVWAESAPGEGATFFLQVPLCGDGDQPMRESDGPHR